MIELTRDDGVVTVVLARPERRNALDLAMMQELAGALAEIAADRGARAMILTGAGGVFCSGLDLGKMGESPTEPSLERALVDEILVPLERLPIPTIAAMNGDAYAGGLELALHCDIRIAVNNARFGMPVARIGIVVPYPLILKLIDTVGGPTTSELLFSGEPLSAERAHQLAMVNRVASGRVDERGASAGAQHCANAPLAVRAMKQAILAGRAQRLGSPCRGADAAAQAAPARTRWKASARSPEKRRPVFRGR
jgi:enoyl-CoA hydratase/carnithine racemase